MYVNDVSLLIASLRTSEPLKPLRYLPACFLVVVVVVEVVVAVAVVVSLVLPLVLLVLLTLQVSLVSTVLLVPKVYVFRTSIGSLGALGGYVYRL